MEDQTFLLSSLLALILLLALKFLFLSKRSYKDLPPSPPSLPFIGHLHLIKPPIHFALGNLSQKYGPIISLRFGSQSAVVVSSASAAEECFTKNDVILANRPETINGKYLGYNHTMLVTSPYGDHWRNLRRIASLETFSSNRLNKFVEIRKDEVRRLLVKLAHNSRADFARVELKPMLVDLTFNDIIRMVAGKQYCGNIITDREEAARFKEIIAESFRYGGITGAGNLLIFHPMKIWFRNYEKKIKNLAEGMDGFMKALVEESRNKREGNSMIDHLLPLQESEPEYYTDQIIKGLVLNLITAGTDTSAVTLEWAMTNLLNHPEVLTKAKEEIDARISQDRLIEESDLANLDYLQCIMWETLRLYLAAPLLLPHMPFEDCTIGGFNVPRGTVVLVNAYAIHRDPTIWDDPEVFKPERFEKEVIKEGPKLLPFGLGRRACPGAGLAQRVVKLALGSMIQCFEWKRISDEKIDMSPEKGVTTPKAQPLEALCKARPIVDRVLIELNKYK